MPDFLGRTAKRARNETERKAGGDAARLERVQPAGEKPGGLGRWRWALGGAALFVVLAALGGGLGLLTATPRPIATLVVAPPPASASAGDTWTSPGDGMVMVYVPAGEFTMGSNTEGDDEKPVHTVALDAFWIDRTEVTNAMFARFVADTAYKTDAEKNDGSAHVFDTSAKDWSLMRGANWQHPRGPSGDLSGLDNHPVVQVSWNDATAYCQWVGRRLPTEAEWEKAARGTDGRTYPWGNQKPAGNQLNSADKNLDVDWADKNVNDGYQFTAPVGNYPAGASPYGVLDMAGNVWNWVADWYGDIYYFSSTSWKNPQGPSSGNYRVLKGGSWVFFAIGVHTSLRGRSVPSDAYDTIGFRCSRSP